MSQRMAAAAQSRVLTGHNWPKACKTR